MYNFQQVLVLPQPRLFYVAKKQIDSIHDRDRTWRAHECCPQLQG